MEIVKLAAGRLELSVRRRAGIHDSAATSRRRLPRCLIEAGPDVRDALVRLLGRPAMQRRRQIDVGDPVLPRGDVLLPEVEVRRRVGGSGDEGIVAPFRADRKGILSVISMYP